MASFLKKLGLFLFLLWLIDLAFKLLDYKDRNIFNDITRAKMIQIAHEHEVWPKMELIILGSSHGQFGISPEILSEELNMRVMSFAYGVGSNTGRQMAMLQKLDGKLSATKVIVWNIDVYTLNNEPLETDEFQNLLFSEKGRPKLLRLSNTYKYFNNISRYFNDVKKGNYIPPVLRSNDNYVMDMFVKYNGYSITKHGWAKGDGLLNPKYIRFGDIVFKPNQKSVAKMDEVVQYCKQRNIQLVITQIPENAAALAYRKKYIAFDQWMRNYCTEKNVLYLDFNRESEFPVGDNSLFFDSDHLNLKGGELFSKKLARELHKAGISK